MISHNKRIKLQIMFVGLFIIILGSSLLYDSFKYQVWSIKQSSVKLDLTGLIFEIISILFELCLIIGGFCFLLLQKWSIYLIRTGLLLLIAIGLLVTLGVLFAGPAGSPPITFYLIMVAEAIALYVVSRPSIKKQFNR